MLFFQSTSTSHKYFPELGLVEHEQISLQPIQSVSRLASEILRFAQGRITGNAEEFVNTKVRSKTTASGSAHVAKLRALCRNGNSAEEEDKSFDPRLSSQETGEAKRRNSWNDMPKFLLAGAVSTVISRTFVAPLERIKLECIVQGSNTWLKIVKLIWTSEGLKGFWKGNTLNLFRMVPFKSINFILYDMYLDHLLSSSENREITNHDRLVGGGISGVVATVVCLPLDTIRTRLMTAEGGALGGVAGCFIHMIRNEGFLSLYKGLTPALISMGPASAVFYAIYDILKSSHIASKKRRGEDSKDIGVVRTLIYGAIAGACAEAVTYPLEVIRRQLQIQKSASLGLGSAFIKMIEKDGLGSLYAGLFPSTLQVLPSASLSYLFYEMMKSVLKIS